MGNIYKNIEKYNLNKGKKILILFDDIIADQPSSKNLNPAVTGLIIRQGRLNFSLAFIMQCYFVVPKNIRPNSTHYFFHYENSKQTRVSTNCI